MEVFTGELTSQEVRPSLGRALVPKEDYGSALYMTQPFFFSHEEISFQSLYFTRFLSKVFYNVQKSQKWFFWACPLSSPQ